MADTTDKPRRRRTRVWEDEHDGWCYEVTHPDGHSASGAHLDDKAQARELAKAAKFAEPGPDPSPAA